jgi:4-diphosphocytidyl-2-C-methyl-D-erythritol kinase
LTSPGDDLRIPRFSGELEQLTGLLYNDLETVTASRYPLIGEIKDRLVALGASGALMSGSGSTVFGIFQDEPSARAAALELGHVAGWRAFAVEPIVA